MSKTILTVFVPGHPKPQGSKTAQRTKSGKIVLYEAVKGVSAWRTDIRDSLKHLQGPPIRSPVKTELTFFFLRPKSVPKNKRPFMTVRPDIDKCARVALDSLTGRVWHDDSQVYELIVRKEYSEERQGVQIDVSTPDDLA